jgi:hypothetical protein
MQTNQSTRNIEIVLNDSYTIPPTLHIKVLITKSRLALPNSAKIEVYNISEKTLTKLESEPKIKVLLDGKVYFTGKVINPDNQYKGTSWICTIYCNDIKTNPHQKPQYMEILKGTSNDDAINQMGALISNFNIDTSAFKECAKSKGSLLKGMVVEYKKEGDITKALQNMFKGCNTEVIKEDGIVKLQDRTKVPNQAKPLVFDRLLESPQLSFKDLVVKIPLNEKVKLGLGFEVKAKSISKKLESPYTYKNKFEKKTYRISEFTHEFDNFTSSIAITSIKGLNIG